MEEFHFHLFLPQVRADKLNKFMSDAELVVGLKNGSYGGIYKEFEEQDRYFHETAKEQLTCCFF